MNEVDLPAGALWSLVPISALCGWVTIVVFRKLSDRNALRSAVNRLWAHVLELSLFFDDPIVMLRVQRDVLRANRHLLKLIAWPSVVLAFFFLIILSQLEALYGHAPLPLNEPAVVTARFRNGSFAQLSHYALVSPENTGIETPGVRTEIAREISWRIRPNHASNAALRIVGSGAGVEKTAIAGSGVHYLSPRRESSVFRFLLHPTERPISDTTIDWIEIGYPSATILHLPWLVWFVLVSSIAAVLPSFMRAARMRLFRLSER